VGTVFAPVKHKYIVAGVRLPTEIVSVMLKIWYLIYVFDIQPWHPHPIQPHGLCVTEEEEEEEEDAVEMKAEDDAVKSKEGPSAEEASVDRGVVTTRVRRKLEDVLEEALEEDDVMRPAAALDRSASDSEDPDLKDALRQSLVPEPAAALDRSASDSEDPDLKEALRQSLALGPAAALDRSAADSEDPDLKEVLRQSLAPGPASRDREPATATASDPSQGSQRWPATSWHLRRKKRKEEVKNTST